MRVVPRRSVMTLEFVCRWIISVLPPVSESAFLLWPCNPGLVARTVPGQRGRPEKPQQVHIIAQLCLTLCNSVDCSMPGFPVLHYLLEFAQNHDHWIRDAIQPSHPQWPPTPPALNLSQHQGLFKWIGTSHQVVKILELQLQHQSFQWIFGLISFRIDWFDLLEAQGTLKSLLQYYNYQLFGAQPSLWSSSYIHRRLLEKP